MTFIVQTKYIGPSETKGARIRVEGTLTDQGARPFTVPFDHGATSDCERNWQAARQYIRKFFPASIQEDQFVGAETLKPDHWIFIHKGTAHVARPMREGSHARKISWREMELRSSED